MITIIVLIIISYVYYFALFFKNKSILVQPTLHKVVFYREYLLLTMIPYLYYLKDGKWRSHYIFTKLDSDIYFYYASIYAFTFILIFLTTIKILKPSLETTFRKIKINISLYRCRLLINTTVVLFFIYLIIVTIYFEASFIGLLKFSIVEFETKRALFTQGGGFFTFNKIIIKSWIPMLSYLYIYMYFSFKFSFNKIDRLFLIISFFMGITSSLWFFEKSVIVFYFIGIVGVYVYSGGLLNRKYSLLFPVILVGLVSLMYIIIYQDNIVDVKYLSDILLHRTFTQSTGSVMAIKYFSENEFFYLSGISNSLASLTGDEFRTPYSALIDYYVPETSKTSGALSSFVTGEAYGLFGIIGVILSGVIVGIYYSFFEATKASNFLSIVFVGLYGLYFSHFYVASSFYSFLWPIGMIYNIFPFLTIALLSYKAK